MEIKIKNVSNIDYTPIEGKWYVENIYEIEFRDNDFLNNAIDMFKIKGYEISGDDYIEARIHNKFNNDIDAENWLRNEKLNIEIELNMIYFKMLNVKNRQEEILTYKFDNFIS